jgi:translocon-associated protein subunit alpha
MKFFSTISLLLLISSFSLLLLKPSFVRADIDVDEDEVDETEDIINEGKKTAGEEEEEVESFVNSMASPFAKASILFVQPETTDLPAGRLSRVLVGFYNNGTSDFIVDSIEGSFRYPQDFSYHIQNVI